MKAAHQQRKGQVLAEDKLSLETRLLQRQLSLSGRMMAWLQATSVPVALLGAVLAFVVGYGQLHQGAEARTDDRFDKALTRLASPRAEERITGVSGLELFVNGGDPLRQQQALQFLINGLSLETDISVRGAVLDLLTDLRSRHVAREALDAALRMAVERDRSLTNYLASQWFTRILQLKKKKLATFNIAGPDLNRIESEIPASVLAALTKQQYLALFETNLGIFQASEPSEQVRLTGLSKSIELLLASGANGRNFQEIYCEDCNFSTVESLAGANFENSHIAGADFTHVNLRGASFKGADLAGTNFFDSDLTNANLRTSRFRRGYAARGFGQQIPLFECAKLNGADLSGRPLVLFRKDFNTTSSSGMMFSISAPRMESVTIDSSTKLDQFTILIAISITDDYIARNPKAPEVTDLLDVPFSSVTNPLGDRMSFGADLRRIRGDYAEDEAKYTDTIQMAEWRIDHDELKRMSKDAFRLRGFVDQAALKDLPLYKQFLETIDSLSAPTGESNKVAQALSAWAVRKRLASQSAPCNSHPEKASLLFDPGAFDSKYLPDD